MLYSYGYHYPLAIRVKDLFLVNCSGYSSTTAKHTSHFYSSVAYENTIPVPTDAMKYWLDGNSGEFERVAIEYWRKRGTEAITKLGRARVEHMKEFYTNEIVRAQENMVGIKSII